MTSQERACARRRAPCGAIGPVWMLLTTRWQPAARFGHSNLWIFRAVAVTIRIQLAAIALHTPLAEIAHFCAYVANPVEVRQARGIWMATGSPATVHRAWSYPQLGRAASSGVTLYFVICWTVSSPNPTTDLGKLTRLLQRAPPSAATTTTLKARAESVQPVWATLRVGTEGFVGPLMIVP